MWVSFGSLPVVTWVLLAQSSWTMETVTVVNAATRSSEVTVDVRDRADLFGQGAKRRAREALQRIHREHRIPVRIETVESLDGAWIADIARRRGGMAGADQLYILVAGSERDVGVIAARRGPASRLTEQQREGIRRAFLGPFREGEADVALEQGVRAIGATLNSAAKSNLKLNGRDALISATILVTALAVLLASQKWARYGGRNRRRRRTAAGATAPAHVGGPSSASPMVSECL
jgi:uncharacterized membrane protein YgcG